MLEPLGQSQVLAYLEKLTDLAQIHVLSFEKPADRADAAKVAALRQRIDAAGIRWHPLTYHKAPSVPATLYDLFVGTLLALWLVLRHRIAFLHARSYPPTLIGLIVKRLTSTRLLFDMRGLWADERTDGGLWPPGGRLYRTVKRIERALLLGADQIVTLTDRSKVEIESFPYLAGRAHAPVHVITTCADLDRFRPGQGPAPKVFTLGYVGSLGTWYLFDEVLAAFMAVRRRRPQARLFIVNRKDHEFIRERLAAHDVDPAWVTIQAADHREVPAAIAGMSAGTAIIKPVYSKIASAPTKLAEYLGCGVPCLGNTGVGDMDAVLEGERVGVALDSFGPAAMEEAVDRLLALCDEPGIAERCRTAAQRHFALDSGAEQYRVIYLQLLAQDGRT
jgi:glycosyltransferase involved in cell wall biosynthesis